MECVYSIWAPYDKTNKMACASTEDSDQPGHPPSLIRVFAVSMKKAWVLSYPLSALRRLWSDWVDAQADLSLRRAHSHFVGSVMRWLIYIFLPKCTILQIALEIPACKHNLIYNVKNQPVFFSCQTLSQIISAPSWIFFSLTFIYMLEKLTSFL